MAAADNHLSKESINRNQSVAYGETVRGAGGGGGFAGFGGGAGAGFGGSGFGGWGVTLVTLGLARIKK